MDIKASEEELSKRWSDQKFLGMAAKRRTHFNTNQISFGEVDGDKRYIISLLPQAHGTYYMGQFHSCVVMCGTILEAMMIKFVKEKIKHEPIDFSFGPAWDIRDKLSTSEDAEELTLNDMIKLFKNKRWLSREMHSLLYDVKDIRNMTVHSKLPFFKKDEEKDCYFLEITRGFKRKIEVPRNDAKMIAYPSSAISAWYCLKKTRLLIREMLKG